jgi:methylamine dehydrogenase accessory protein MauD
MSPETLTVAVVVLAVIVAILTVAVFALARQIGILHTRLAPAGALMNTNGQEIGSEAPRLSVPDIDGNVLTLGGESTQPLLLLFVSPSCPVCKELVPVARSLARREKLRLVFASDGGDAEKHREYIARMGLGDYPYIVSAEVGLRFAADKLPYAALVDRDGVLRSRGLVNSREHLESLVESMLSGFDSIQDYLVREHKLEQVS